MLVPYILIYGLVISPMKTKKNQHPVKRKKLDKMGIGDCFFALIVFGGLFALVIFVWAITIPLWLDLPSMVTKQYENTTGQIGNVENEAAYKSKTWGFDYLYLNGESYPFEDLNLHTKNQKITIYYLKHSKYIIRATDSQGNVIKHTFSYARFFISLILYGMIMLSLAYFTMWKHKIKFRDKTKRTIQAMVSFHIVSILILIIEGYDYSGKPTSIFLVLLTSGLFHYIYGVGGLKKNMY